MQLLLVILIWQFGEPYKDQQINCTPFILQAWVYNAYTIQLLLANYNPTRYKPVVKCYSYNLSGTYSSDKTHVQHGFHFT